jgi:hypothetical protein
VKIQIIRDDTDGNFYWDEYLWDRDIKAVVANLVAAAMNITNVAKLQIIMGPC